MMQVRERPDNSYDNAANIAHQVAMGGHRAAIGGLWEVVGRLQVDFLIKHGLKPDHLLLDLGCGALRGGVKFVPYLNPGHYYGVDLNQPLLDAGYDKELVPAGLADRLPRGNLHCIGDFGVARIGKSFDYVIALSVFTHIRLERIRQCLTNLTESVKPGGKFFATFWLAPEDHPDGEAFLQPMLGIPTQPDKDPYHHKVSGLTYAAAWLPWDVDYIGDWNHPRDQKMIVFTRR